MSAVVAENTKFTKFQLRSKKCTVVALGDFLENMLRSLEELRLMLMSPNVAGNDKREVLLAFRAGGSTRVVNSSFAIRKPSSAPIRPGITESMRCRAVPIAFSRRVYSKFELEGLITCVKVRQVG